MVGVPTYEVPAIDWDRTASRVMTLDWIDGIKISHRDQLIAAGHDMEGLAANLVHAFLRQAIAEGFFHADMHHGNRSEEHTSELQSLMRISYAVFCLKTTKPTTHTLHLTTTTHP